MKEHIGHFSVHGPGIVRLIRQAYWFENKRDFALGLLKGFSDNGKVLSQNYIMDILKGNMTIIGSGDSLRLMTSDDLPDEVAFRQELESFMKNHSWEEKLEQLLRDSR